MKKIDNIADYKSIENELPITVSNDINKRIADWMMSGGTYDDSYIKQQFRYAENVLKVYGGKEIA